MKKLDPKYKVKQSVSSWYAIHTKYKCEKYVVKDLLAKDIQAYTPVLSVTKQYTRKRVTREIPLINCYVFVYTNKKQFVKVLQTEYVFSFLKIGNELAEVKQEEIDILKRITGEYNEVELQDMEYTEGMQVEIVSGNLTGVQGVLIEKQGKHNFLVELKSLSYQLIINVDPTILMPIKAINKVAEEA